ncbi:FTR1 family iron permease [Simplicispira psychrophila]|uniref:FTR1 family iron permease n=1 Tax=Simplicispira psychrophila TaxID=80882 RepID=UPI00048635FD|nr:FTR1 family protein [Simplicispira psychrophila]
MVNAFVIVWRESLEAMLVIGILSAWVNGRGGGGARTALWSGVLAGLALAVALAALMQGTLGILPDEGQEIFQTLLIVFAALLMTHMVLWMRRHARGLRREMESALDNAAARQGAWGIAAVAALAVAREGAETVIFLQGMASGAGWGALLPSALAGFALAGVTAWAAARGLRLLPQHQVLRASANLLLLFAAGMLVLGSDRLISLKWLPPGPDPLWDTSAWLDDGAGAGKWLADLFGYRARPATANVVVFFGFWLLMAVQHGWPARAVPKSAIPLHAE